MFKSNEFQPNPLFHNPAIRDCMTELIWVDFCLRNLPGRLATENLTAKPVSVHGLGYQQGQSLGDPNWSALTKLRLAVSFLICLKSLIDRENGRFLQCPPVGQFRQTVRTLLRPPFCNQLQIQQRRLFSKSVAAHRRF